MDNPKLIEDPVIQEIRQARDQLHEQTKHMTPEELSRWYTEQANAIKKQYYSSPNEDPA
jgi:hypothetical protein